MSLTPSSIQSGTNIITEDIVLSSDFTLPANCVLIFQGGKFVTATGVTSASVTGNNTVVVAGLNTIFGSGVTVSGSWKVPEFYPEWFDNDGTFNDAVRINKAIAMASNANPTGGIVKLTGSYNISSTIIVPIFVNLEGANPYGTSIVVYGNDNNQLPELIDSDLSSRLTLTPEERLSSYSHYYQSPINMYSKDSNYTPPIKLSPAIYFHNRNFTTNRACGAKNFTLKCRGVDCDGIVVDNPYDQSVWENIQVEDVNIQRSAFVFRKYLINVGQTVLLKNCMGLKKRFPEEDEQHHPNYNKDYCFKKGQPAAPVFKFYAINETTLIGCKAFAFSPQHFLEENEGDLSVLKADIMRLYRYYNPDITLTDEQIEATAIYREFYKETYYRLLGGTCFEFMDCHGITIEGCSVADASTGILINAKNRNVGGYTVTGLTAEKVWSYDLFTDYSNSNEVSHLCILPIRKLNTTSGIMLNRCALSYIVTVREQDIALKVGQHNFIYSVQQINTMVNHDDNSIEQVRVTPAGNSNVLVPSYNTGSRGGVNVSNQLAVRGLTDNAYAVPGSDSSRVNCSVSINALATGGIVYSNGKERISLKNTSTDDSTAIKNNAGNELLKVATATTGATSLRLQVNVNGTMKYLPVEIGAVDANGYCTLRVKTN